MQNLHTPHNRLSWMGTETAGMDAGKGYLFATVRAIADVGVSRISRPWKLTRLTLKPN